MGAIDAHGGGLPFNWEKAPAHVEVDSSGLLKTTDGCISELPKVLFEYDVTAPAP